MTALTGVVTAGQPGIHPTFSPAAHWGRDEVQLFMEEPLPVEEKPPEIPEPRATSLLARMFNVFAVPGQVFDEVKATPVRIGNWLVPTLLWAIVAIAAALVVLAQPEIEGKLKENFSKTFDKQVQAGKMTEADAAKGKQAFEILKTPAVVGMVIVLSFVRLFWWAFILWLFGLMFLRSRFNYMKGLEVAGLAIMISVLGVIVALLLTVDLGPIFSGQRATLVVGEAALNRRSKLIGGAANVFSLWMLTVMSVGLSRIAGVPFLRAAWLVFAWWLMQQAFFLLLGFGQAGL